MRGERAFAHLPLAARHALTDSVMSGCPPATFFLTDALGRVEVVLADDWQPRVVSDVCRQGCNRARRCQSACRRETRRSCAQGHARTDRRMHRDDIIEY